MLWFLIRHAQSRNNALPEEQRVEDPAITDLGHRQASALASWLGSARLDRLLTSPFRRALETTEYVRRRVRLPVLVWADLHEQGGCYAGHDPRRYVMRPGMARTEIESNFPGYQIEPSIGEHGWWRGRPYETMDAARARASRLIARMNSEFGTSADRIATVVHADFKQLLLQELLPVGDDRSSISWSGIYNAAVTAVEIRDGRPRLIQFNTTGHLSFDDLSL